MVFKIGVTGATGYVGRNIVKEALRQGYEVHVFTRTPTGVTGVYEHHWDITDESAKPNNYSELHLDALIHCAALADETSNIQTCMKVNVGGTLKALNTGSAKRFVHISTASVYLNEVNKTDLQPIRHTPNELLSEVEPYVYSKMVSECSIHDEEKLNENFFISEDHKAIILRPHIVYGKDDSTLLPKLLRITKVIKGTAFIVVPGGAKSFHSITHIDTLVSAAFLAATTPNTHLTHRVTTHNVSDNEPVLLADKIKEVIQEATGATQVVIVPLPKWLSYTVAKFANILWNKGLLRKKSSITRYSIQQLTEDLIINLDSYLKLKSL